MHRCTIHGVETTRSIWLRFSTLLSIGLFFRKHLQGLPAMQNFVGKAMVSRIFPFGHAKKCLFQKHCLKFWYWIYAFQNSEVFNNFRMTQTYSHHIGPMGLPDKLYSPGVSCCATAHWSDQKEPFARRSHSAGQSERSPIRIHWVKKILTFTILTRFCTGSMDWTKGQNVSKCWGKLVLFTMTPAGII